LTLILSWAGWVQKKMITVLGFLLVNRIVGLKTDMFPYNFDHILQNNFILPLLKFDFLEI